MGETYLDILESPLAVSPVAKEGTDLSFDMYVIGYSAFGTLSPAERIPYGEQVDIYTYTKTVREGSSRMQG